ncbi:hypothetical protein PbB2_01968 [Candidatus Phycosocius bacilliformis]|uniref:UPF0262 protein PbB2_01968 n=1 Tax=Candidatus Phycosocius bacilliformis TaxID=1445552 RepID=A0A2P2EB51_9PROT|nr:UPF0262 family protein [Candidatus Phycosocius bacilliformis]GBF58295.1 hypothetical protein PbB2_01968 [Candidatus Phycosocius bacilliformis]
MSNRRIADVRLDEESLAAQTADGEHERRVAIFDLLEANHFDVIDGPDGPYSLVLSVVDQKLVFDVKLLDGSDVRVFILSLSPFKRVIKDYFMICESYHQAIRQATPTQIEAIDMGRRGLHNEGSRLLETRLEGKVGLDFDTARRLFTLICALHVRL